MIRNRLVLKTFTVFFLAQMILSTVAPTVSWALTAGPTAPEATSFEPVDTTDLVNLNTGDFTYNMPLLEVPGPAGSYPLSLSYHAGITNDEEASWTGLGWTLNPGSITRNISGIADDFDGAAVTERVFWEGGKTKTGSVGVSIGIANIVTVGAGVDFSQDTYRGFGIGGSLSGSLGYRLSNNVSLGVSGEIGISPYGQGYSSAGVGLSLGMTSSEGSASVTVGLSVNSAGDVNVGVSGGISTFGNSVMGASISSRGNSGVSVGAFSNQASNFKSGKISTESDAFSIDVPVWYGINVSLGKSYSRYWIDATEQTKNYGSLYYPSTKVDLDDKAFDTYNQSNGPGIFGIIQDENAVKQGNGSFPDYDQYSVNAQGIAGNFRPYHYNLTLFHQNIVKDEDKQVIGYYIPQQSKGVHYRFINDFSNHVLSSSSNADIDKVDISPKLTTGFRFKVTT